MSCIVVSRLYRNINNVRASRVRPNSIFRRRLSYMNYCCTDRTAVRVNNSRLAENEYRLISNCCRSLIILDVLQRWSVLALSVKYKNSTISIGETHNFLTRPTFLNPCDEIHTFYVWVHANDNVFNGS